MRDVLLAAFLSFFFMALCVNTDKMEPVLNATAGAESVKVTSTSTRISTAPPDVESNISLSTCADCVGLSYLQISDTCSYELSIPIGANNQTKVSVEISTSYENKSSAVLYVTNITGSSNIVPSYSSDYLPVNQVSQATLSVRQKKLNFMNSTVKYDRIAINFGTVINNASSTHVLKIGFQAMVIDQDQANNSTYLLSVGVVQDDLSEIWVTTYAYFLNITGEVNDKFNIIKFFIRQTWFDLFLAIYPKGR
jgi:hypothetical protein